MSVVVPPRIEAKERGMRRTDTSRLARLHHSSTTEISIATIGVFCGRDKLEHMVKGWRGGGEEGWRGGEVEGWRGGGERGEVDGWTGGGVEGAKRCKKEEVKNGRWGAG